MGFFGMAFKLAAQAIASSIYEELTWEAEGPTQEPGQVDLPLTGEGVPVPLVYGKTRVRRPGVIWWGDTDAVVTWQSSESVGTYEYHFGLVFGLSLGVDNADLTKIWAGDSVISSARWSTGTASGGGFWRDLRNWQAFGGRYKGGEFRGRIHWYPGDFAQVRNPYLEATIGATVPAHRGLNHVVFYWYEDSEYKGTRIGRRPSLPAFSFELEGYPDALTASAKREIDDDANPAEVIYDILTGDWGRLGIPTANVDSVTFTAVATTLHDTDILGLSLVIDSLTDGRAVIGEILRHIDAVLYENLDTNKLELKLIRDDYNPAALDSFGDSETTRVESYNPGSWAELPTEVQINFEDRDSNYAKKSSIFQNVAKYYGATNEQDRRAVLEFPYCRTKEVASLIATRELKYLGTPRVTAELVFTRSAFDLRPGDVFKWSNSEYGITDMIMRVASYDLGTPTSGEIRISCAEDIFALYENVWEIEQNPLVVLNQPAEATIRNVMEAGQWHGYRAEKAGKIPNRDHSRLHYLARAPDEYHIGFNPEVSSDAGTTVLPDITATNSNEYGFAVTADVETAYLRTLEPFDNGVGLRIDTVEDTSRLRTVLAANIRDRGLNLILVVEADGTHEWMAYEDFTDIGGGVYSLDDVWRGLFDTAPIAHAVNAKVFISKAHGINSAAEMGSVGRDGDEVLEINLATSTGILDLDTSGLTPDDLTLVARSKMPYPAADIDVDGSKEYPGTDVEGEANPWVVTEEITTGWTRRLRTSEQVSRGDDADETPEANTSYLVEADDGGGYDELGEETGITGTHNLQPVADGATTVRVRTVRADAGGDVYSFTSPDVLAQVAHYRQLLVNPGFDDATDGRGWTVTAGDAAYVTSATSYGFFGKHVHSATTDLTLEQVVDVAALTPSGEDARLTFYARDLSTAAATSVTVTMTSEKADNTVLDTVSSATTPSQAYWDRIDISIAGMNALTVQIRVKIQLVIDPGSARDGAVDMMDLRIGKNVSANLTTNGGFNANLNSWTVNQMVQASAVNSEGAGEAWPVAAQAACDMWQNVALAGPFAAGDIALLRCIRYNSAASDTGEVILEARDGVPAVLRTATTGAEAMAVDGDWHVRELYMLIPAGTTHFRTRFEGVLVGGANIDSGWDDVSLFLFDVT